jgi:PAS domain S-box-containing protein
VRKFAFVLIKLCLWNFWIKFATLCIEVNVIQHDTKPNPGLGEMKMAKTTVKKSRNWLWFGLIGFFLGLAVLVVAVLVVLSTENQPVTLQNAVTVLTTRPLMWILLAAPLFLAILLGYLGAREDRIFALKQQLDITRERAQSEIHALRSQGQQYEQALSERGETARQSEEQLVELQEKYGDAETKFQETELAISRGKKQWEATFDAVQDLLLLTDENGVVVRCNQATPRAFQTDYSGIIGKPLSELFGTETNLESFASQKIETRFARLDGWYEVTSNPLQLDEDRYGNVLIVRNVSERKQASTELQLQKQYYEALFRNSPLAIVTLRQDQTVIDCNPAFEAMFGYNLKDIRGKSLDPLIAPQEYTDEARALNERVSSGEMMHLVTRRMRADGTFVDVDVYGIPVVVAGKQLGILGIYHDLSGLHLQEETGPMENEEVEAWEETPPLINERPAPKISTIEGIGPVYAEKLGAVGIFTTADLLEVAGSRKGREELVEATGISATLVLGWVNRADLMRVPGVGEEYSDLLEAAGVDTVKELRNRNPENLYTAMSEKNAERKLVRRIPSQSEVTAWVAAAKEIEPMVSY